MARDFEASSSNRISAGGTNVPTTTDFSVVVVVKPESLAADNRIIGSCSTMTAGWQLRLNTGELRLVKQSVADIASSLPALSINTAYAVAAKCDVDVSVRFFQRKFGETGVRATTVANASAINAGAGVQLGHRTGANDLFFDGVIGNCAIYEGLLADEVIKRLMDLALSNRWGEMNLATCRFLMPLRGSSPEIDFSGQGNHTSNITGTTYTELDQLSSWRAWKRAIAVTAAGTFKPSFVRNNYVIGAGRVL